MRMRWGCCQCSGADENLLQTCTVFNTPSLQMSLNMNVRSNFSNPSMYTQIMLIRNQDLDQDTPFVHRLQQFHKNRRWLDAPSWSVVTLEETSEICNYLRNMRKTNHQLFTDVQKCHTRLVNVLFCLCMRESGEITHMVATSEASTRWQNVGVFCTSLYPPDGAWN